MSDDDGRNKLRSLIWDAIRVKAESDAEFKSIVEKLGPFDIFAIADGCADVLASIQRDAQWGYTVFPKLTPAESTCRIHEDCACTPSISDTK